MRVQIAYYAYVDDLGDDAKQGAYNQAIFVNNQQVIGYLYGEGGIYYDSDTGNNEMPNGTYLVTISNNYLNSTYIEVTGQTPPSTTTTTTTTTITRYSPTISYSQRLHTIIVSIKR